jgi:ABC-type bacteriocin/lantibiotic exporter with double-glycine peptidase domain
MPSHQHEALLQLFRNRPALAPELLREALHMELPEYSDIRIDSADLNDIQPAEYRADLVVLLTSSRPVLGIIVECFHVAEAESAYPRHSRR